MQLLYLTDFNYYIEKCFILRFLCFYDFAYRRFEKYGN